MRREKGSEGLGRGRGRRVWGGREKGVRVRGGGGRRGVRVRGGEEEGEGE